MMFGRQRIVEDVEFHIIKSDANHQLCFLSAFSLADLFLHSHKLPVTFSFSDYLRVCMAAFVVNKLEVKTSSWSVWSLCSAADHSLLCAAGCR